MQKDIEVQEKCINGIRFCPTCKNILVPFRSNDMVLEFICGNCGKKQIDYSDKTAEDCLLYSRQLKLGTRGETGDRQFALDPSMPRLDVICQQCGNTGAVYYLQPDLGQRRIKVMLVCSFVKKGKAACGNTWQLPQNEQINS